MAVSDVTVNSDLIVALAPVAFIMIVGLMTWMVRELSRISSAVIGLDTKVADVQDDIKAQDIASAVDREKFDQHVKDDAVVAGKVAYIEGRMRGGAAPA